MAINSIVHCLSSNFCYIPRYCSRVLAFPYVILAKPSFAQAISIDRAYSIRKLHSASALNKGRLTYVQLQEASNQIKTDKIFAYTLSTTLKVFSISPSGQMSSQSWNALQEHLLQHYRYQLPLFNKENDLENIQSLISIFRRTLVKGSTILTKPSLADYIFTPTEIAWAFSSVGVPFIRNNEKVPKDALEVQEILNQCPNPQALPKKLDNELDQKAQIYALATGEKDACAASLLITPHLNDTTLLYEVGCWNGQNLLNLLFYASLKDRVPKHCIGIDINFQALSMAQSVASLLALHEPFMQFYLSNAIHPLDPRGIHLKFSKEVRFALRLIPVLDPNRARAFLLEARKKLQGKEDIMVVSFALPKGQMYEANIKRAEEAPFKKEEFSGGVVISQKFLPIDALPSYLQEESTYTILNTYYTREGFTELVHACGFKIQYTITVQDLDNERVVAQLQPV